MDAQGCHRARDMKITNKLNLPQPLVDAITYSDRNREGCDYTITELIEPPRIGALKQKHANELEEDASDRIWALVGSAAHEILRRAAIGGKIGFAEERAIVELNGFKIGGQMDFGICNGKLTDYKVTSVYTVQGGGRDEWTAQENCYAFLCSHYGVAITELEITAIMRDWSVKKARQDDGYPPHQVATIKVPMWTLAKTEAYLVERIAMHEAARAGNGLPECSDEDMWAKPEKYAVMMPKAKRAKRVFDNWDEAVQLANEIGANVQHRPAERPRCEDYCVVSQFCESFKKWKGTL